MRAARVNAAAPAGPAEKLDCASGYLHPSYAASFGEWGTPWALRRAGGWALIRAVPGSAESDAMGCYPLLACTDWSGLAADLEEGADRMVAFSAVVGTLAKVAEDNLRGAFPHVLRPFKEHFVIELSCRAPVGSAEHRRKARRARARVNLDVREDARPLMKEWMNLYTFLIRRHDIRGMRAFSMCPSCPSCRSPGCVQFAPRRAAKPSESRSGQSMAATPTITLAPRTRPAMLARPPTRCSTRRSPGSVSAAAACWTWAPALGWSVARTA